MIEDGTSKVIFAHMLPRKGLDEHVVARVAQDLKSLGYKMIILKSDQEPALLALKDEVRRGLAHDVMTEASPAGESQRNGRVERVVRTERGRSGR